MAGEGGTLACEQHGRSRFVPRRAQHTAERWGRAAGKLHRCSVVIVWANDECDIYNVCTAGRYAGGAPSLRRWVHRRDTVSCGTAHAHLLLVSTNAALRPRRNFSGGLALLCNLCDARCRIHHAALEELRRRSACVSCRWYDRPLLVDSVTCAITAFRQPRRACVAPTRFTSCVVSPI